MAAPTLKFLIKGDSDLTKAEREMRAMASAAKEAGAAFKGLDAQSHQVRKAIESLEQSIDKPSLFGRFKDSMKSLGNLVQPFNQGLELAGKVAKFAEEGLDAYAKTSKEAAKDVKALTDEFTHYRDVVMASVGQLTVELLKPAVAFEEQRKKLLEIGNTPAFKVLYGDKGVLTTMNIKSLGLDPKDLSAEQKALARRFGVSVVEEGDSPTRAITGLGAALGSVRDQAVTMIDQTADHWDTRGKRAFDSIRDGLKDLGRAAKEARQSFGDIAVIAGMDAGGSRGSSTFSVDALGNVMRGSIGERAGEQGTDFRGIMNTSRFKGELPSAGTTDSGKSAFAAQLEEETRLLDSFSQSVAAAYGAVVDGSTSATSAFKGLAKQQLLAFGVKESAEAISQIGYGFGALANPLFAGAAAMHFASAAKHAAAAGIAGIGVAAVNSLGSSVGAAPRALPAGGSGGGTDGGTTRVETKTTYVLINGDQHAEDSPRMRQRNAQRMIELAEQRTSASRAE